MQKNFVVSNKMQEVAVDILSELEGLLMTTKDTVPAKDIVKILDKYAEKYKLCKDPFVQMLCTSKEFAKSYDEWERQTSIERYGYDIRRE